MAEQLEPNMVINIHVHKALKKERNIVYYKKKSKGEEMAVEIFSEKEHFKLKEKKAEKGNILKKMDSSFIVEFNYIEDNLTESWIEKKAKELAGILTKYDFLDQHKVMAVNDK